MIRSIASLATVLLLGSPVLAGELDKEYRSKAPRAEATQVAAGTPATTAPKVSEMDAEGPAMAWHGGGFHGGYGGFHHGLADTATVADSMAAASTVADTATGSRGTTVTTDIPATDSAALAWVSASAWELDTAWDTATAATATVAMVTGATAALATADMATGATAGSIDPDARTRERRRRRRGLGIPGLISVSFLVARRVT